MASCADSLDSQQFARLQRALLQVSPSIRAQKGGRTDRDRHVHLLTQATLQGPTRPGVDAQQATNSVAVLLHDADAVTAAPPPTRLSQLASKADSSNARNKPSPRCLSAHSRRATPSLISATSAPITMTAFDETPSQTGMYHVSFGRLPMFAGAGGDTQPDSQIYKNYSSMIKSQDAPDNSLDTPGRTTADTDGPRTYTDGDAGHVNLIEHWEASLPGDEKPTLDEGSEDELGSSSPQVRIDLPHESMRMPPKTPTTAGQKRNYRGEIISSTTTKTPGSGLATFFGHGVLGPAMSLTQMFNATQAPSSPLPVGFRSDPVFDRPSPNFAHHHSSPVAAMSSLAKDGRPDLPRTGIEPRDTYISMKESQERRARRKRQEQEQRMKSALQGHGDGGSDEESDSAEQKVARRMQRAQISTEAMRAWSGVTAPPRRHGRQTLASASTATGYVTPARSIRRRRENREIVEISDDIPAVDATSEAESVDEYDELAQTIRQSQSQPGNLRSDGIQVPMTASRAAGHPLEPDDDAHSPSVNQGIAEGLPLNTGKDVVSAADSPQISGSSPKPSATTRDMQLVAVADSQLQNAGTQQSLPPPRPVEPSSMQSLVPASQIASLSPETRVRVDATILSSIDTSSIPLHPTDTSQLVEDVVEERLPSSPPLLAPSVFPNGDGKENVSGSEDELNLISTRHQNFRAADDAIANDAAHVEPANNTPATHVESGTGDIHDHRSEKRCQLSTGAVVSEHVPPKAPGSSARASNISHARANARIPAHVASPTPSHSTVPFETAHTHLSASPSKRILSHQKSSMTSESPKKGMNVRRLIDIAADPTPPDADEDVDMDVEFMTRDDLDFLDVLHGSSPVRSLKKHRKVYGTKPIQSPVKAVRVIQELNRSPSKVVQAVLEPAEAVDEPSVSASLAAVNKLPVSTPHVAEPPTPTPPSVRKRGEAGKHAAARARQTIVTLRPTGTKDKGKLPRAIWQTKRRAPGSRDGKSLPSVKTKVQAARPTEVATTPGAKPGRNAQSDPHPNARSAVAEENSAHAQDAHERDPDILRQPATAQRSASPQQGVEDRVLAPRRVLALFKGNFMAYYPAICLGTLPGDSTRLQVAFDDGTIVNLEKAHVISMDMRVGDLIKVDLNKMKAKTYVVCGFRDQQLPVTSETDPQRGGYPCTDIHGFATIVLAPKRRDSVPAQASTASGDTVNVPMGSIYATSTMWKSFKDRVYAHRHEIPSVAGRLGTPLASLHAPMTPTSRSRRQGTSALALSRVRDESVSSSCSESRLFNGMAFAVTYTSKECEKDHLLRLIVSHGGCLVNEGFDELFVAESLRDSTASLKRSPSKSAGNASSTPFRLTREAQNLGFTALISDRHSRRAKYMQALALGLPCLAGRWVLDCIKQNTVLPWERYLLPAGESSFLGAVRSRVLLPFPAAEARLSMMVDARPKLLDGRSVLLVTGKGRIEEKRKVYVFLTRALGAKRVAKAANIELAKNMLEEGQQDWDLVYVDGPEKQAEKFLFGTINGEVDSIVAAGAGKKRKRGDEDEQVRRKVKVVGDEFIIQSLILGALLEQ